MYVKGILGALVRYPRVHLVFNTGGIRICIICYEYTIINVKIYHLIISLALVMLCIRYMLIEYLLNWMYCVVESLSKSFIVSLLCNGF